ncbi:MAG TPA: penicillin acylase family protein [Candidatus Dormibacteraeota bacterium]|nr:penicillin acylase family protein [Candidatus Dormibacteraeota bacterium]
MLLRRTALTLAALVGVAILAIAAYGANIALGMHVHSRYSGEISGLGLKAPVRILRDARGVPHIIAAHQSDLFFAEGYVEGEDRLFQLDLIRRFVLGDLSALLGSQLLPVDENARMVPVAAIVRKQWAALAPRERLLLQRFADGINAAATRNPLPVEYRLLLARPPKWTAQDSLSVGMATVVELTDSWNDIATRSPNAPLTDPCYDAPVTTGLRGIADPHRCTAVALRQTLIAELRDPKAALGSNEWAAGAARTRSGRALLENDPHLRLGIPGVWYLVDLRAPGYHAAGATLAGTPGVILGHNDTIAWGATNGATASLETFVEPAKLPPGRWVSERFHVRLGRTVTKRYWRGAREFGVQLRNGEFALVRWPAYDSPASPLPTFDALDRARSMAAALRALRGYPGPTQNFVIADRNGNAAYQLAGVIPADPLWAREVRPGSDLSQHYGVLPFVALPHVTPSRNAVLWTANNKMYGPGYPYRLSAQFVPPYRAFRIATLLRARTSYSIAYFTRMQMDVESPAERELARIAAQHAWPQDTGAKARLLSALRGWNGEVAPSSVGATAAVMLRRALVRVTGKPMMQNMLAERTGATPALDEALDLASSETPQLRPWGSAGALTVRHPLAALGARFLNGSRFVGDGDAFVIHVQREGFSQSFRAVWEPGAWDRGGITIPQGESGEPGSPWYTDESNAWVAGKLLPLPWSRAAVRAATRYTQILAP